MKISVKKECACFDAVGYYLMEHKRDGHKKIIYYRGFVDNKHKQFMWIGTFDISYSGQELVLESYNIVGRVNIDEVSISLI